MIGTIDYLERTMRRDQRADDGDHAEQRDENKACGTGRVAQDDSQPLQRLTECHARRYRLRGSINPYSMSASRFSSRITSAITNSAPCATG